ncbi:hypothetical protein [Jatrophihabitans fulvus]
MLKRALTATGIVMTAAALTITAVPAAHADTDPPLRASLSHTQRAFAAHAVHRGTVSAYGIRISVPTSATVYNKRPFAVTPKVAVNKGVHKVIAKRSISVYSGKRRIAHGATVRVRAGRYTQKVSVRYRAYTYVTKYRTVTTRTFHPGGMPDSTACVVTAVLDDGSEAGGTGTAGDGRGDPTGGTCTNARYPKQSVTIGADDFRSDTFYDASGEFVTDLSTSQVGTRLTTSDVSFAGYYTTSTKRVAYKVKTWIGYRSFVTRARALVVHDGGYERVFSGYGGEFGRDFYTSYFRVPKHWKLGYSYDCTVNDYPQGNWILDVLRPGEGRYDGENLNNDIDSTDTAVWNLTGAGKFRLHVFTQCVWAIIVRWR